MSEYDGTSSGDSWDALFADFSSRRLPRAAPEPDPPLTAYASDEFTAPIPPVSLVPVEDESPTTVIPIIPRGTAELSTDQSDLLERLRTRGEQAPTRSERHRGSKHRGRSIVLRVLTSAVAFSLTLVVAAGAIAGALYEKYNGQLHRVDVIQKHDPNIRDASRQQNAENFLVIGSDSRAGLGKSFGNESGARSDTTMIVHLSPSHTQASIISIPRDSWVTVPSCKAADGSTVKQHKDMFNAAFSIGGPSCTISTVQKLTGIAVTHFVEIDFKGFEAMVQAMGTVTICSPEAVDDPGSGLHLHVGDNPLDGAQALAYVRARETLGDGSDLGRIKRQQIFMGAVLRQAMDGSMLTNPTHLTKFLDAATKAITIDQDTTIGDLRTLAGSLQDLDTKRVAFYTAPIADPDYSPPGTSMTGRVLLDSTQGRALYDSVIQDRKPVWVTDVHGKKVISTTKGGATKLAAGTQATRKPPATRAPAAKARTATKAPAAKPKKAATAKAPVLPKANLNAAQRTCSL